MIISFDDFLKEFPEVSPGNAYLNGKGIFYKYRSTSKIGYKKSYDANYLLIGIRKGFLYFMKNPNTKKGNIQKEESEAQHG